MEFEGMKPQHEAPKITPQQFGNLHSWDVFLEQVVPQLEEDRKRMHEITPFELKQGEAQRL